MRLTKEMRREIVRKALKAVKPSHQSLKDTAYAAVMFTEWQDSWIAQVAPVLLGVYEEQPSTRPLLAGQERSIDFGPINSFWNSRRSGEVDKSTFEVMYYNVFLDEVVEPIINQLASGRKVSTLKWNKAHTPDKVRDYLQSYYQWASLKEKAKAELHTAVGSCATTKTLTERYPELADYLPKAEDVTTNRALTTQLKTFKELISC